MANDDHCVDINVDIKDIKDKDRKNLTLSYVNDDTTREGDYQIAICQDGKFAVTFDTANFRIRILENTDRRPFAKEKDEESDEISKTIAYFKINDKLDINYLINKTKHEASIKANNLSSNEEEINCDSGSLSAETVEKKEKFSRWSLGISNKQQHRNGCEYSIFVAVSRIDVNGDMKENKNDGDEDDDVKNNCIDYFNYFNHLKGKKGDDTKGILEKTEYTINSNKEKSPERIVPSETECASETKGTAIYCLKLKENNDLSDVAFYYSSISGICRFIEEVPPEKDSADPPEKDESISKKFIEFIKEHLSENNDEQDKFILKRFIVLTAHGIYNYDCNDDFNLMTNVENFDYPKIIKDELEYCRKKEDCMDLLLTCLYNQYFLVEQHQNYVQALNVYNLAEMDLKTTAKRIVKKDKHNGKFNRNTFTIGKLQLCFTRGLNSIELYLMENGLKTVTKKIDGMENIYLLEFIDNDNKLLIIGEGGKDGEDKDQKKELKFIIWDLYKTEKVSVPLTLDNFRTVKDFTTRLARTSGNLLKVDDKGKVTSVLKQIELKQNKAGEKINLKPYERSTKEPDNTHNICLEEKSESIVEKEPWMMGDYEGKSYCISATETETLQLIVGGSTVQIWRQIHNKGETFLEYIWANDIPIKLEREENRLQVEDIKHEYANEFCLKVFWYERNSTKIKEEIKDNKEDEKEAKVDQPKGKKTIRWKYINEIKAVKHACKALKHLNKRRKFLGNNHIRIYKYEEMVMYIKHIIWRFVKNKPVSFRLLDVRYNVMKDLILGDCNHLIKFILFGDDENKDENKDENSNKKNENENEEEEEYESNTIHIPRNILWSKFIDDDDFEYLKRDKQENYDKLDEIRLENNLELAIYSCEGLKLKNTIIIAYLLEYYSKHATKDAGWMSTVSKALPLLFKYNYDDYARKLFRKECFADQHHFSAQDPYAIIPKKYLARRNHDIKFLAFKPIFKLETDKQENLILRINDKIYEYFETFKCWMYEFFKGIDEDLGRPPLALRVVPLPEFTRHKIKQDKVDYDFKKIISNILWFIFIPRTYKISQKQKNLLSPFSEMIRYENNDDIYDNPTTEAVIDFRWRKAGTFFFFLFLRFLVFAICFVLVCEAYLNHKVEIQYLIVSFIIFYYLAIYILVTEFIQFKYYGLRKYFDIYNVFDICSIVLPVVIMSIMLKQFQVSDGFGSVTTVDTSLIAGISFSIFFLWIETILYLRLISYFATYIYYFIIIFKTIFPFLLFFAIAIIAFASTMFILLENPEHAKIPIKNVTLSGDVGNNSAENITLRSDFNPTDPNDNPFSLFSTAILASYYWLNGNMVQREHFDFWAVDLFTLAASVFLVSILQNMLIAFMSGVYEETATKGRQALLRYRANKIADYEALYHTHLWPHHDPEPKYVYYIGQSKNFEEWYKNAKELDKGTIYQDFEEKCTFTKYTFKESDYYKYSVWKYGNIKEN